MRRAQTIRPRAERRSRNLPLPRAAPPRTIQILPILYTLLSGMPSRLPKCDRRSSSFYPCLRPGWPPSCSSKQHTASREVRTLARNTLDFAYDNFSQLVRVVVQSCTALKKPRKDRRSPNITKKGGFRVGGRFRIESPQEA